MNDTLLGAVSTNTGGGYDGSGINPYAAGGGVKVYPPIVQDDVPPPPDFKPIDVETNTSPYDPSQDKEFIDKQDAVVDDGGGISKYLPMLGLGLLLFLALSKKKR
jgi:hypothetical protein